MSDDAPDPAALERLLDEPAESLVAVVGVAAAVFYWAEVDANDNVNTYWDALHYIATSLSVGYANIFPVTPVGKLIGAAVMMIGPALSGKVFKQEDETGAKLGEVVAELKALRAQLAAAPVAG
jgi:hypothetical protein